MSGDVGAEVAAAIREAWHETGFYARADLSPEWLDGLAKITSDALAPLIAVRVEAAKAEALREAADAVMAYAPSTTSTYSLSQWLYNRAAALDPEATP